MADHDSFLERIRRIALGPRGPERRGLSSRIDLKSVDPFFPIGQADLEPVDGPREIGDETGDRLR